MNPRISWVPSAFSVSRKYLGPIICVHIIRRTHKNAIAMVPIWVPAPADHTHI